jgi:4-amino-4-deoxy-L-arabinose transferase-like glycosyltransferase
MITGRTAAPETGGAAAADVPEPEASPSGRSAAWYRWALLGIVVFALVFRLAYVLGAKPGDFPNGDQFYYSVQASMVADGQGFDEPFGAKDAQSADHPPMTVLVMALVSWGNSDPVMRQRLLMAVLGAAVVGMIGLLGMRAIGRRTGLIAAALTAVYAAFWMNDGVVMSETLSALCIAALLLSVYWYLERPGTGRAAVIGLLTGLTVLARSEMLLVIPLVLVPTMLLPRFGAPPGRVERWRHLLVAVGVTLAALAPWTIYNLGRFDRTVLLSTNEGLTIYGANCPDTYSGRDIGFWSINCALVYPMPEGVDQSEKSIIFRQAGLDYIRDNLDRLPAVLVARHLRGWSFPWRLEQMVFWNTGEGREPWASWIGIVQYWLLVPVAVAGGVILRRRREVRLLPLVAMPVLVFIVTTLFYGLTRFRLPAEIAFVVLAAAALDQAWSCWRRPRPQETV